MARWTQSRATQARRCFSVQKVHLVEADELGLAHHLDHHVLVVVLGKSAQVRRAAHPQPELLQEQHVLRLDVRVDDFHGTRVHSPGPLGRLLCGGRRSSGTLRGDARVVLRIRNREQRRKLNETEHQGSETRKRVATRAQTTGKRARAVVACRPTP